MQSPILPISNPNPSSSSMIPTASATASTMFLRSEDDLPSISLHIPSSYEDDKKIETRPFLSRSSSYTTTTTTAANTNLYQQRRRRTASDTSLLDRDRRQSFREDMGQAASTITQLTLKMLRYLGQDLPSNRQRPLLTVEGTLDCQRAIQVK
ncbi:unnamed protein product [Ilex paraguariensis]|uniref:Uncharacterized protein n=1 Tax=Ilex paraguariensis TaxID=185542 RepID=A0ABC8S4V9_9AQUA